MAGYEHWQRNVSPPCEPPLAPIYARALHAAFQSPRGAPPPPGCFQAAGLPEDSGRVNAAAAGRPPWRPPRAPFHGTAFASVFHGAASVGALRACDGRRAAPALPAPGAASTGVFHGVASVGALRDSVGCPGVPAAVPLPETRGRGVILAATPVSQATLLVPRGDAGQGREELLWAIQVSITQSPNAGG